MPDVRRSAWKRVLPIGVLSLVAACGSNRAVTLPGTTGLTLPASAVDAIRDAWSDAEVGSPVSATCPGATGAPVPGVAADFNGDGQQDVAVWVARQGRPHLALALARLGGDYDVHDAGEIPQGPIGTLEIGARGTTYRLKGTSVDGFLGLDTLIVRGCDGARVAYTWTGSGLRSEPLE